MNVRSSAGSILTVVLVAAMIVMLIGQQLGQPILLGFVVTGSMQPTLDPGDGFIAVPPSVAGDIEEGDVVTFDAQELQGGGLTTHRVVGRTDQGYITQGDANPFTDQDGDEPPVQESQIVAVAWQFNGAVVSIPYLGTAALALQGGFSAGMEFISGIPGLGGIADGDVGTAMVAGGVLLLLYSFLVDLFSSGRGDSDRSRSRKGMVRASVVLAVVLFLILAPVTASMVLPSGVDDITIVSSESPSDSPTVIQRGGSQEVYYNVSNSGYLPRVGVIEPASTGVVVADRVHPVSRGETSSTTATIFAPDETGAYVRSVSEWQYIQFLPVSVIVALHDIHPFVAVVAIDLTVAIAVTAVFVATLGVQPFRFRSRSRNLSFTQRLRRQLREWF